MDCRNGVDASTFFLFEDSGDSEADPDPLKMSQQDIGKATGIDDAESCSSDSSDTDDHDHQNFGAADNIDSEGDNNYKEPANQNSSSKMLVSAGVPALESIISKEEKEEEESISRVVGEGMDEMEDRVFWETCLAQ